MTEQQLPMAWATDNPLVCGAGITRDASVMHLWVEAGFEVVALYTAPPSVEGLQKEVERLKFDLSNALLLEDVLRSNGFVKCDIPACNCGSWHHRYGLKQRWEEIKEALQEADVLNNDVGNVPLKAVQKLITTNAAQAEQLVAAHTAMQEFVDRCDRGEARSNYTYSKFVTLLQSSTPPEPQAVVELTDDEIMLMALDCGLRVANQDEAEIEGSIFEFLSRFSKRVLKADDPYNHRSETCSVCQSFKPKPLSAAQGVPPILTEYKGYVPSEDGNAGEYYIAGWNGCREEMLKLSAAPEQAESKEEEV